MNSKLNKVVFFIGGIFTVVGALAGLFDTAWSPYVFSLGAATIIVIQFISYISHKGSDRYQRLARMSFISSLFLALAAYFMCMDSNSWVVALLIYALSSLFISFRGK